MRRTITCALAGLGLALSTAAVPASAATLTDAITATVSGTPSAAGPTSGILTVWDNVTAQHHTRTITYYQHDGYLKTENLVSSQRPIGVVLKGEDISYACTSSLTDASVNPPGGYPGTQCQGQLLASPVPFKLGGDLIGRFCRKAQPPDTSPADCTADPVHVTENACTAGEKPCQAGAQWLQVGNKDHGGMMEVDYYCNVHGTDHNVNVTLPPVTGAIDYNGHVLSTQVLVTQIVLLPLDAAHPVPSAALQLQ